MIYEWLQAAVIRAAKTAAQTAIGILISESLIQDVNWEMTLGAVAIATLLSLLHSVAGIPEVSNGDSLVKIKEGSRNDHS